MIMIKIAILLAVAALLITTTASAWNDNEVVYAVGMGMFAKEIQWQTDLLKEKLGSGKIKQSEYNAELVFWKDNANIFNQFIKGNFNASIYQKWKLVI